MDSRAKGHTPHFTIAIGDEVRGPDGKLGEVEKLIVDAEADRISEVVVKHGFLWGNERVIPLEAIQRSDGSVLYTDIDQKQFKECAGFDPGRYREPDPDYSGPPAFDADAQDNFPYRVAVTQGSLLYLNAGKTFGYPGGEVSEGVSRLQTLPVIQEGDAVLSSDYEKVGEVSEFEGNADGFPTRLVVKQGFLFKREAEIPAEWIAELSDKGVVLNVSRDEVRERTAL
ncbi:MAG: PRC-barrel domain-containing protein [Hyphomicrobiales bacterium]